MWILSGRHAEEPSDRRSATDDRATRARRDALSGSPSRLPPRRVGARRPVADGVALVTLDRPEALNALSFDLLDELADALETLDADPACRAIVLTGAGHAGVRGRGRHPRARDPDLGVAAATAAASMSGTAWPPIGLPLIAAVRGFALGGGCELAMACDMIVAGDDATFGQPEIRIGVMPGAGGTQRLTRAIGKARAMELILTGRTMTAAEADAAGLVTRVVPAEATLDAALELAGRIAAMPPLAVRAAKAAVLDAARATAERRPRRRARRRSSACSTPTTSPKGMAAFTEKRPPVWAGR